MTQVRQPGGSSAVPPTDAPEASAQRREVGLAGAALDGILAGLVTVGVATLLAAALTWIGFARGTPSPLPAVGGAFVDRTPLWLKNFAVEVFGTSDKLALFVGMALVLTAVCAALGILAHRRQTLALVLFALLGAVGAAVVLTRPNAEPIDATPTVLGTLAGIGVLHSLAMDHPDGGEGMTRRRLFAGLGGLAATVVGFALSGSGTAASESRAAVVVPKPTGPATIDVTGAQVDVPDMTPYVIPNADFYRIDTALVVPRIDTAAWSLRVWGEVEQEVTIDWAQLLKQPLEQHLVTLTCVSNEVGGNLAGNAVWTGWPVRKLLAMARPKAGADMVLSSSDDGFTAGTPLSALTDNRNALIAVAMNGEPLPFEHGFPARLVVPGLYGYVSATKWVTGLKVTRFAVDQGYWTPRGWSALGPIKTASRIDVPSDSATVSAGTVAVAGVAWAQHRGIDKVEVQVDDGPWQQAQLAAEPTIDSWRQWVLRWDATTGRHTLRVRATDATGALQVEAEAPPAPNGATGYHAIDVTVS